MIERAGLAEFFLICWDLMRFAREQGIPAQGRGSAASSIVAYTLGISRVEPIQHNLLFERFINEGRTTYPDVDIDFSSARREEVIQYVYGRYGPEHTGMVCNLVTYRARSAVREVGVRAGVPAAARRPGGEGARDVRLGHGPARPRGGRRLRRVLQAPGRRGAGRVGGGGRGRGARPGRRMGQLNHAMGGRVPMAAAAEARRRGWASSNYPGAARREGAAMAPADRTPAGPGMRRGRSRWPNRRRSGDLGAGRRASVPGWARVPRRSAGAADGDPGWWHVRGRGRARRHAGERRLAAGRAGTGYASERERLVPPGARRWSGGRSGERPGRAAAAAADRGTGRAADRLGRPARWDPPAPAAGDAGAGRGPRPRSQLGRPDRAGGTARQARGGSTVGLSHWERWLEFCARIDGFPRHLSIHSGGMLVTAAPLIDIAPLERATMPDRVVVQFDKRDVETLKLIKLDLLGLGMLAAMDETLQLIEHDCAVCLDLDRLPEDVPEVFEMLQAADTVGVFQVESRAQMQTLPKSRPQSLDDLVVEVAIIRPGPIQGNAVHPYLRRKQGLEPVTYLHPSLEPVLKDSMGVILYQEQVMRIAIEVAGFSPAE